MLFLGVLGLRTRDFRTLLTSFYVGLYSLIVPFTHSTVVVDVIDLVPEK